MGDWGASVLTQYELECSNIRKGRGALLCETEQGLLSLQEYTGCTFRLSYEYELLAFLQEQGFTQVDIPIKNKEENLISTAEDGRQYVLRSWFNATECNVFATQDLILAARNLAHLHRMLRQFPTAAHFTEHPLHSTSLSERWLRHNRELWRIRNFMRGIRQKTDFEEEALRCFPAIYAQAEEALAGLMASGYEQLFTETITQETLCHGNYHYHNVLIGRHFVATTGFSHFSVEPQIMDFYRFARKLLEKHGWDFELWELLLRTYEAVNPLTDTEQQVLRLLFLYPEKYWKQLNYYFNNRKSWISARSLEKLAKATAQISLREQFVRQLSVSLK